MPEMPQDRLALDRGSIRTTDENSGHLHVAQTPISKANVCGYYGAEIPEHEALGLKPDKLYQLLRDPTELAKSAKTFDGKPLLIKHRAQSADDHDHDVVVGSVSNPVWDAPYLKADLSVWDGNAITAIENNKQRQLSCGYFYRADMTPGTYQGERYDGRMVDIAGNHTALVDEGRAGPDVMVGDSKPKSLNLKETAVARAPASRQALLASTAPAPKQSPDKTERMRAAFDSALRAKLGADANITDVVEELISRLEEDGGEVDDDESTAEDEKSDDEDDDDDKKKNPFASKDKAKDKAAKDKGAAAKDKGAKDKDEDDDDDKPKVTKSAMDAAINAAVSIATKKAEASAVKRMNDIAEAREDVRPYIGVVKGAFDSAHAVHKMALDQAKVDLAGVPPEAYRAMVKMLPVPGAEPRGGRAAPAMDSAATVSDRLQRFPHFNRLDS